MKTDNVSNVLKSLGYKAMPSKKDFIFVWLGVDMKNKAFVGFYYYPKTKKPVVLDGIFIREAKPSDLAIGGVTRTQPKQSEDLIAELPDDLKDKAERAKKTYPYQMLTPTKPITKPVSKKKAEKEPEKGEKKPEAAKPKAVAGDLDKQIKEWNKLYTETFLAGGGLYKTAEVIAEANKRYIKAYPPPKGSVVGVLQTGMLQAEVKTGKKGGKKPKETMTYELAMAAAKDAANAQMRMAGRTSWNDKDMALAVAMFEKLWPEERDIEAARNAFEKELVKQGEKAGVATGGEPTERKVKKAILPAKWRLAELKTQLENMQKGGSKTDVYAARREVMEQEKYLAALERGESVGSVDFNAVIKRAEVEYNIIETVENGINKFKEINLTSGLSNDELLKSKDQTRDLGIRPLIMLEGDSKEIEGTIYPMTKDVDHMTTASLAHLEEMLSNYNDAHKRLWEILDGYYYYQVNFIAFNPSHVLVGKGNQKIYAVNADVAIMKALDYYRYTNSAYLPGTKVEQGFLAVWIEKSPPNRSIDIIPEDYLKIEYKGTTIVPMFVLRKEGAGIKDKIHQLIVRNDNFEIYLDDKKAARDMVDRLGTTTTTAPDQPVPSAPATEPAKMEGPLALTKESVEAFAKKKAKKVKPRYSAKKIVSCAIDGKLFKAFLTFIHASSQGDEVLIWWTPEGFTCYVDRHDRFLYVSMVHLSPELFLEGKFDAPAEPIPMLFKGSTIKDLKGMIKPGEKEQAPKEPASSSGRLSGYKQHTLKANAATGAIRSLNLVLEYGLIKGEMPVFTIKPKEKTMVPVQFNYPLGSVMEGSSGIWMVKESEELYQKLQPDGEYGRLFVEPIHAKFYAPLDLFMGISTKTSGISKDDDPCLFAFDGNVLHVYGNNDPGNQVFMIESRGMIEANNKPGELINVSFRNTTALRDLAKNEIFHKIKELKDKINNTKKKIPIMIKGIEYPDKTYWISYKGYAIVPVSKSDYHVLRKKPIEYIDHADTVKNAEKIIDSLKYEEKVKKMPRVKLGISQDSAFMFETAIKGNKSMMQVIVFPGEAEKEFEETEEEKTPEGSPEGEEGEGTGEQEGQTIVAEVTLPNKSNRSKQNSSVGTVYDFKGDWQQMDQPRGLFIEVAEDKFVPIKKKDIKEKVVVQLKYKAGTTFLKKRGLAFDWKNERIVKAKKLPEGTKESEYMTFQQQIRHMPKAWMSSWKAYFNENYGNDRSRWPEIPELPEDFTKLMDETLELDENLNVLLQQSKHYQSKQGKGKNVKIKGKE
jgi:hypothetical protein